MMSSRSASERYIPLVCVVVLSFVYVALGSSLVMAGDSSKAVNNIVNNVAASTSFSVSNPVVIEGDSGTLAATFSITRSVNITQQEVITVSTINGTATAGDDFDVISSEVITFAVSQITKTIDVVVNGDALVEADEDFSLNIDSGGSGLGTATIANDDIATVTLSGDMSIQEGDTLLPKVVVTFTAKLDKEVPQPFEIPVTTVDGTAVAGVDYEAINTTLKFDGTITDTKVFTTSIISDIILENDETFLVELGALTGVLSDSIVTSGSPLPVTITDDDQAGVVLNSAAAVDEEDGEIVFTALLTATVEGGFTVPYTITDGTAESGLDYISSSGVLTFTGERTETQTITVAIIDDAIVESNETFSVMLGTPVGSALGPNAVELTADGNPQIGNIQNTDTATISLINGSPSTLEGSENFTKTLNFTFQADAAVQGGFEISYATADVTATGGDYQPNSGSLVFSGGANETQAVSVVVNGDSVVEPNETFSVTLSSLLGNDAAVLDNISIDSDSQSTLGTIENDETAVIQVAGAESIIEGNSGQTDYVFRVILLDAVQGGFDLDFETTGITANSGEDYIDNDSEDSQPLSFDGSLGEEETIIVKVIGDTKVEPAETFIVDLLNFSNFEVDAASLILGSSDPFTATIAPDDGTVVSFVTAEALILEADTDAEVEVQLNDVSDFQTEIDYVVESITATVGSDFTAVTGTLIFPAGDITKTISIPILNDNLIEFEEDIKVTLSNPAPNSALLGIPSEMIVTIIDDDGLPTVSFSQSAYEVSEAGGTLPVSVTLSRVSGIPVTVMVNTVNGTATAGSDFTAVSQSVVIPAGDDSATVNLAITDDTLYERSETFTVTLSSLVNADPGARLQSAITIIENDAAPLISIDDVTVAEADGLKDVEFTVSLNKVAGVPISVNYATQDGTATVADGDYLASTGTLLIPAGQTTGLIQVTVLGDEEGEGDETFSIILSAPVDGDLNPVAGASKGDVVLTNDDFFRTRLPFIRNGAVDGPDLVSTRIETRSGQVYLTIRNIGNEPVEGAFWVDLFINPTVLPTQPNDTIDSLGQPGIVWLISGNGGLPLAPGESLELTVGDAFYSASETNFSGSIPSGSVLVAHVDSANVGTAYGAIREGHERVGGVYNNVLSSTIEADISVP